MKKRSITIAGHATSITLEDEFWDMLRNIAVEKELTLNGLITIIDEERETDNLCSAIRIYILKHLQQKIIN